MKHVLLCICLFICIGIYAQAPSKKTLICDETQVVKSGDERFRIITTNDSIAHWMSRVRMSVLMVSYSGIKKKDTRRGDTYWERSYYFEDKDYAVVIAYIKGGFK